MATAITAREPGGEVGVPKGKGGPFVRAPSSSACVCLSVWQPQTLSLSLSLFFSFLFFSLLFFSVCSLPRRLLPPLLLLLLCACSFGLLRHLHTATPLCFWRGQARAPFLLVPSPDPTPSPDEGGDALRHALPLTLPPPPLRTWRSLIHRDQRPVTYKTPLSPPADAWEDRAREQACPFSPLTALLALAWPLEPRRGAPTRTESPG